MNTNSLKVLFLDIGGVLLSNGWGHLSRQAAAKKFSFDYDAMNYLHEFIFDIYEEGKVSLDEYLDSVLFYEPRPFSKEEFKAFMVQESKELPGHLLDWLINWKSQHPQVKVFSINNEPKDLNDYRIKTFDLRRLFDGFISSCDVGLRKPDPQIFKLALAVAAIEPHECIYIDDREVLTRAGSKMGMKVWQHKTVEETTQFLSGK
ncbi:MAG TPA: HAD-IA family hydrolase [Flavisolibacter sp.]|nr:HAD-IA family hydrolase [Flavisolibacter sp.]